MAGQGAKICLQVLTGVLLCCTVHCQNGGVEFSNYSTTEMTALREQLLGTYDLNVRPNGVTVIQMQMHVTAINSVDIKNEIFSVSGWWSMVWQDTRLSWNTTSIPVLQFDEDKIWTPVLVVSNSINDLSAIDEDTIPIRVDNKGTVLWNPPALLKTSCSMDVTYFPFDVQTCGIEVTSFGYTIQELDIKVYSDGLSFRYYQSSGEWEIKDTSNTRLEYSEDGYTYARVSYLFKMERKPLYYGVNMILPIVVNTALTLFVFLLPPESGEKIGYCLTVLLAFMVILTLVATELPSTASSTPLLEIYIAIALVLGGMSVILAIVVLHIFFLPDEKPVPHWAKRVCLFCSRAFWISRVGRISDRRVNPSPRASISISASDLRTDGEVEKSKRLSRRQASVRNNDQEEPPKKDMNVSWQFVATVIDGVCLRVYSLFLLISTIVILVMLSTSS